MKFAIIVSALTLVGTAALPHSITEKLADCACDAACYTDEVKGVGCSGSKFSFQSIGLPDASHTLMVGISGNNQQMPVPHSYRFSLPLNPKKAASPTATREGAVGVAVNGVPIFSPDTQGPVQSATGRPVSAADAGELDQCGGHAGRGDDYHYHRAPNCLIEELGKTAIESERRPIGWAADGFPIYALGWFTRANRIEDKLDQCRGATDAAGRYFYNVEPGGDYAVIDCYSGTPQNFARDRWDQRKDAAGKDIVGIPIKLTVTGLSRQKAGSGLCYRMDGTLSGEQVLKGSRVERVNRLKGALFHCSQSCYGHFVETKVSGARGRVVVFEAVTSGCPGGFEPATKNGFLAYVQP